MAVFFQSNKVLQFKGNIYLRSRMRHYYPPFGMSWVEIVEILYGILSKY